MTWPVLEKQLFPKCCQKSLSKFLVCSAKENTRREQRKGSRQRKIFKLSLSDSVSVSAEDRGTRLCEKLSLSGSVSVSAEGRKTRLCESVTKLSLSGSVFLSAEGRGTRLGESETNVNRYPALYLYQLKV
jgi:hypothetical protein